MLLSAMSRAVFGAAAILAGLSLSAPAAQAQPASNTAVTNVTFCNNTGAKVYIALVFYDPAKQKWMLSAWKTREAGQCASAGRYRSGIIYYFAEKEGGREYWPSKPRVEKTFCVPRQAVERPQVGGNCPPGERLLGFRGFNATGAAHRFNLNN